MALELGPYGIRTNAVNPTVVMTAMGRLGWTDPDKKNTMLSKIPLGRFAGEYKYKKKYITSSVRKILIIFNLLQRFMKLFKLLYIY